jgi:hypothetical protein
LRCLVDSGASFTIAGSHTARLLGVSPLEIAEGHRVQIAGLGGRREDVCSLRMDLEVSVARTASIVFPDASVYFGSLALPGGFDMLLGQVDALERMTFAQMNHPPEPCFVLRFPPTR